VKIGWFALWVSAAEAKEIGCTHHARMFGIVPGFFGEIDGIPLWVARSDVFVWVEDAISTLAAFIRQSQGEEPLFMFKVGREIV